MLLCCLWSGIATAASVPDESSTGWMETCLERLAGGSSQALVVTGDDSSGFHATLHLLEKREGAWRSVSAPLPALIGEKGFAPPGAKREGDLRTPSGIFGLRRAFGYAPRIPTRMPYRRAGKDDLWVDDVSSPDYNRWVKRGETAASSFEVMRLDDHRYKYGIIVEYNTEPVVRGRGSAIFIHVRLREDVSTSGCVALSEGDIIRVLAWLDPAANPVVLLGTRESLLSLSRSGGDEAGNAWGQRESLPSPGQLRPLGRPNDGKCPGCYGLVGKLNRDTSEWLPVSPEFPGVFPYR
jgi:L,D-peptidoglycan transpeptidase YkuD (ErfK/YbiS/YcfS/YnhG family)